MTDDLPEIPPLDTLALAAARARQAVLTKPTGALGRLEDLSIWVAGAQGTCPPKPFERIRVVVFAGDHGVAHNGVSAYPSEVTAQMVGNFLAGGAAVNVLARLVGATVRVIDISVDAELPGEVSAHKVRRSSGRIDVEDAISVEELDRAFAAGRAIADEEVDAGADLLVPGDMGIGNTTPAAVLVAALTNTEPARVVGRGTGIDDAGWMRKTTVVRDALHRTRTLHQEPMDLLRTVGGADLAAMTGFLVQASVRRTPVVLDGVISATCALLAERLAPGASSWWLAGHRSTEPAQRLALDALRMEPLVDLGLRLGEGTGALLAVSHLQAAVATLGEMATFDTAGVSGKQPGG